MSSYLPPKIMIIDKDTVSRTFISNFLERNGFDVLRFSSNKEVMEFFVSMPDINKPNLILIDDELDNLLSSDFLDKITNTQINKAPILYLLKDNSPLHKIFELDEILFLKKPIVLLDLISKIKSIILKTKPNFRHNILSFCDLRLVISACKVYRKNREIHLGPKEFKLLLCLLEKPSKILSRQYLIDKVMEGESRLDPRTIDVHINRLRNSLHLPQDKLSMVKTIRGEGYCLQDPKNR